MSKARGLADLGNVYSDGALSNRNLIINGAMQVAQRGTSFAGLTNATGGYTLDRWAFVEGGAPTGVFTVTQDTDAPDGFASSLKWDCTTADATLAASDYYATAYRIEAQDLQHLNYGSAAASETTLSFWVKSNKVGSYVAWVYAPDGVRQYQVPYTIDVADTWEKKTGVIPADTAGTINNDNGTGLLLSFALASGTTYTSGTAPTSWEANLAADNYAGLTVNLADNTANYWNITGVQLEVGDTATPFEHRSYGQELALCQRYYERFSQNGQQTLDVAAYYSTTEVFTVLKYSVKRASPTVTMSSPTALKAFSTGASRVSSSVVFSNQAVATTRLKVFTSATSATGVAAWIEFVGALGYIEIDAEL